MRIRTPRTRTTILATLGTLGTFGALTGVIASPRLRKLGGRLINPLTGRWQKHDETNQADENVDPATD